MSGETENQVSGWTVDTLKAYCERVISDNDLRYQQRFESQEANLVTAITAQEKAVSAALAAAEKAVGKAEVAAEKRFDAVNEFRGQLSDQARDFMPRKEAELQIASLEDKVSLLQQAIDTGGGRAAGLKDGWGYLVGVVSVAALIVTIVVAVATH